jgi:hypothetical protein
MRPYRANYNTQNHRRILIQTFATIHEDQNLWEVFIYKGLPQQAEVAQGVLVWLKAPDFLDVQHYKGGRSSALGTGCLFPRINPWYSFLAAESTPEHMVLSVAMKKIPSDTTGNRSRDRPTSSAVP